MGEKSTLQMTTSHGLLTTALLVVWAALLFGGFIFGHAGESGRERMPLWTRMASSLTLAVAAWTWYATVRGSRGDLFGLLLACGMTLGLAGDLAMAGLLPLSQPVIGGMAFFGLGHIAYITAIVVFANQNGLDLPMARWGALGCWCAIGLIGWMVAVLPSAQPMSLRSAALPYTLLLAGTAGAASGLAWQAPSLIPLALGTALFFFSDLVVAGELFAGWRFRGIGDLIWLTYGPGQMLIVYSIPLAAR